jgi:hypothetical protein
MRTPINVAHKDPLTLLHLGSGVDQPLDVHNPRPHVRAIDRRLQGHEDVRALLQKVAKLTQHIFRPTARID